MSEVEDVARAAVVWVAETDGSLVGGGRADVELAPREQARLHELGPPLPLLALGERLEQCRVDDGASRPVKGADEVLARRQVDCRLAADRRVHLADEGRRHRDPVHAAEMRGGREAGHVGRAASADGCDRPAPVHAQRTPEPLQRRDRLRLLAGKHLVGREKSAGKGEL